MKKRRGCEQIQKRTVKTKRAQKSVTIGMDLGDRTSRYCMADSEGEILREGQVQTTKAGMTEAFGALARGRIAIEVGTHSPWVSRLLRSFGHEIVVANPRQVKLITESSRKDDRLDAQTLARLARIDPQLLRPIQHRSETAQMALTVIRVRAALIAVRTSLVNTARGLAKAMGERLPKCDADQMGVLRALQLAEEPINRRLPRSCFANAIHKPTASLFDILGERKPSSSAAKVCEKIGDIRNGKAPKRGPIDLTGIAALNSLANPFMNAHKMAGSLRMSAARSSRVM